MAKLIESDEDEAEELAETEPKQATRNTDNTESYWPMHALLILIAAGLIVGLVFLARWIYHETKNSSSNKPATSQSQAKNNGNSSSASNKSAANGSSQSGSGQKSSSSASSSSQSLPNNGPGNVIGVFAAASFAAAASHYIVSLRKTAREN